MKNQDVLTLLRQPLVCRHCGRTIVSAPYFRKFIRGKAKTYHVNCAKLLHYAVDELLQNRLDKAFYSEKITPKL